VPLLVLEQAARSIRSRLGASPLDAERVAEETLAAAAPPDGRLQAIAHGVERGLGTLGAAYLDEIIAGLESRWRSA
jgi:hypothetical protein